MIKTKNMKTLKIVLILLITLTFIQCADNSSSDPGGSTLNPQYAYILRWLTYI